MIVLHLVSRFIHLVLHPVMVLHLVSCLMMVLHLVLHPVMVLHLMLHLYLLVQLLKVLFVMMVHLLCCTQSNQTVLEDITYLLHIHSAVPLRNDRLF